ncbi:hypothetical protein GCM10009605_09050 [Nocardiopsis composta]
MQQEPEDQQQEQQDGEAVPERGPPPDPHPGDPYRRGVHAIRSLVASAHNLPGRLSPGGAMIGKVLNAVSKGTG